MSGVLSDKSSNFSSRGVLFGVQKNGLTDSGFRFRYRIGIDDMIDAFLHFFLLHVLFFTRAGSGRWGVG